MSLLYKTILSFFPSKVDCTFVGEPWFLTNYELQLDVLRLCQMGYAKLLFTSLDRVTFTQHVMCCVRRYIDENYCPNNQAYYTQFIDYLTSSITNGKYLLPRSWFNRETSYIHVNVFLIELNGCSYLINPDAGDFGVHIDSVMDSIVWCYKIYGQYTRSMIVERKCITFFNNRLINNDIKGVNKYILVLPVSHKPKSIWTSFSDDEDDNADYDDFGDFEDYDDYEDYRDAMDDYYECNNNKNYGRYTDLDNGRYTDLDNGRYTDLDNGRYTDLDNGRYTDLDIQQLELE
jgi:hypothetical protein